jgi:hypothetical protein
MSAGTASIVSFVLILRDRWWGSTLNYAKAAPMHALSIVLGVYRTLVALSFDCV